MELKEAIFIVPGLLVLKEQLIGVEGDWPTCLQPFMPVVTFMHEKSNRKMKSDERKISLIRSLRATNMHCGISFTPQSLKI